MRYTNKDVLAIRDDINLLLRESGNDNELFLRISQSLWQIWSRKGKEEVMLVDYSTNDQAYRWFEGFNLGMKCNCFQPKFDGVDRPVNELNTNKTTIISKVLNYLNQL